MSKSWKLKIKPTTQVIRDVAVQSLEIFFCSFVLCYFPFVTNIHVFKKHFINFLFNGYKHGTGYYFVFQRLKTTSIVSEVFMNSLLSQKTHKWCFYFRCSLDSPIFDLYDYSFLQTQTIGLWITVIRKCIAVPLLPTSDLPLSQVERGNENIWSAITTDPVAGQSISFPHSPMNQVVFSFFQRGS